MDLLQVSESCAMLVGKFSQKERRPEKHLEVPMKFKTLCLAGIALTVIAIPAVAHHSFAMFDASKTVTLQGTVKDSTGGVMQAVTVTISNPVTVREEKVISAPCSRLDRAVM